jgi:hypothetical protein
MKNIHRLFAALPNIGWGDAKEWTGSLEDYNKLHSVLTGQASMALIYRVTQESQDAEERGADRKPLREIIEDCKKEDTYLGHMLRNYEREGGEFIIPISMKEANLLAKLLINYTYKAKQ